MCFPPLSLSLAPPFFSLPPAASLFVFSNVPLAHITSSAVRSINEEHVSPADTSTCALCRPTTTRASKYEMYCFGDRLRMNENASALLCRQQQLIHRIRYVCHHSSTCMQHIYIQNGLPQALYPRTGASNGSIPPRVCPRI